MRLFVSLMLSACCVFSLGACSQGGAVPEGLGATQDGLPSNAHSLFAGAKPSMFKFRVVANFTGVDGLEPLDNVTADAAGNLFGTTFNGFHRQGTVFKISRSKRLRTLYNFNVNLTNPGGDAVSDKAGNLYGTTTGGVGSSFYANGGIYKLGTNGIETVLYAFSGGADGNLSFSNLVFGPDGSLYGTASLGGNKDGSCAPAGCGVVFKTSTSGDYSVVYTFGPSGDGNEPNAGVTFDSQGNMYGTTEFGGDHGFGTVYKIDPSGKESILYSFQNGADGGQPTSDLVLDTHGNIYGTASAGGKNVQSCRVGPTSGCGVVFELSPSGQETTLHEFGGQPDGAQPLSGLILDTHGNLYGTTREGGKSADGGIVFEVTTAGQNYTILHKFVVNSGEEPVGALHADGRGDLFGTTSALGKGDGGTVYELIPESKGAR